jgi:hypothetical protein
MFVFQHEMARKNVSTPADERTRNAEELLLAIA